jgi:hypothetical protein
MTTTATMEVPHGAAQSLPDSGGVRGLDHNDPMKGAAPGAKLGAVCESD